LPVLEDLGDVTGLVQELGEGGVGGRLESIAGVSVEELRDLLGLLQQLDAFWTSGENFDESTSGEVGRLEDPEPSI
jgi:hypothetical protein